MPRIQKHTQTPVRKTGTTNDVVAPGTTTTATVADTGGVAPAADPFTGTPSTRSVVSVPSPPVKAVAKPPVLPTADGTGALSPWGGPDPSKWRPEAIMANAASKALNDGWAMPGAVDVVVAIPSQMHGSTLNEFGDGQTDAAPQFPWWNGTAPPMTTSLISFQDGSQKEVIRFDKNLPYQGSDLELVSDDGRGGWTPPMTIKATRDGNGDLVATINIPPGSPLADPNKVTLIHPKGWNDWFPSRFKTQVTTAQALVDSMPANLRTLNDGSSILDPMGVSLQSSPSSGGNDFPLTRLQQMNSRKFQQDFSGSGVDGQGHVLPWNPADIHGRVPGQGRDTVTGVGTGWTWVASQAQSPTASNGGFVKSMYTGFDARNPQAEASAPDGGVPSGGGWHQIGDPAETILNTVEDQPLPVGYCQGNTTNGVAPPTGGFSYGCSDVASIRFLQPGEAFMVPRGNSGQPNYHWYFMNQSRPVVTQELVHPWVPPQGSLTFGNGP